MPTDSPQTLMRRSRGHTGVRQGRASRTALLEQSSENTTALAAPGLRSPRLAGADLSPRSVRGPATNRRAVPPVPGGRATAPSAFWPLSYEPVVALRTPEIAHDPLRLSLDAGPFPQPPVREERGLDRGAAGRDGRAEYRGQTLRSCPFAPERFHVLLNSLFKVLFNFPSRYLFAIGLVPVFSLRWSLPPTLGCILKQPDS